MVQWTRELTQALGINEGRSEPGMSIVLMVSFAIVLQAPLTLLHAGRTLFAEPGFDVLACSFLAALAVFTAVVSYRDPGCYEYFHKPACGVTWSALSALVTGSLPVLVRSGMANVVVLGIAGMALGVSVANLLLFHAHLFTRTYIPDVLKRSFAGAAITVMLEAAVMPRVSNEAALVICAALLAVNIPLLLFLLRNAPAIGDYTHFKSFSERRADTGLFLAKVALPVACTGVVFRIFFAQEEYATTSLPVPNLLSDLNLLVLVMVAYIIIRFANYGVRSFGWPFAQLFSFLIPLVCLLGCVSVSTNVACQGSYDGGTMVMFCILLSLTWSFMGGASLEYLLRSASVFGMSLASLAVGILVGEVIVHAGLLGTSVGSILLSLVCLAMAIGYLPPRPALNMAHSTYTTPLRSSCAADEETETEADGGDAKEETAVAAAPTAAATAQPAAEEPAHAPVKGRFMRRCDAVAKLFLLSARETEVLYLLAKGRSMNHIMEDLVISEGTAKTHINHVYKKLGVHSRHELLDLIESMEVETIDLK